MPPKSQIILTFRLPKFSFHSIWDLGFDIIWDLGFRQLVIWDLGFGIWDFGIWILNLGGRYNNRCTSVNRLHCQNTDKRIVQMIVKLIVKLIVKMIVKVTDKNTDKNT